METPYILTEEPLSGGTNYWREDPILRHLVRRLVSDETWAWAEPQLDSMGAAVPTRVEPLAVVAERNPPTLRTHERDGSRIDAVDYHPAYRELERIAYGSGVIGLKYDPEVRGRHSDSLHAVGFALGYLFCQSEAGLYCPLCMTDGAARVIERHAAEPLVREFLPRLAARDVERLQTGAMFLTEKQGGSDVGANATRAVRHDVDEWGERWRLYGEKWFCSNVDAGVALVLARPEGAPAGTRGLGLFLLPRPLPDGSRNDGVIIDRLKDKFGTRSMPTGEIRFEGALAYALGDLGQGFKTMVQMVNLSRLYNAVASAAAVRRAVDEAGRWAQARKAFGRPVVAHPLAAATLADLRAESIAATTLCFAAIHALDRLDSRNAEGDARLVRLLTPLAKGRLGKLAVAAVSEAMELIGGNGYIEEWPLPRLLRDGQVLPIWEGTTNIQVLDSFRAMAKESAHLELFEALREWLAEGRSDASEDLAREVERTLGELAEALPRLAEAGQEGQHLWRRWYDRCGAVTQVALCLREAAAVQPIPDGHRAAHLFGAAAERLVDRHLRAARPLLDGLGSPVADPDLLE